MVTEIRRPYQDVPRSDDVVPAEVALAYGHAGGRSAPRAGRIGRDSRIGLHGPKIPAGHRGPES
ncbi:MAG: hypothetical protein M3133_05985, partial [Actinomycetota bacterium]|nr:hypothetical protein [Actinomycetota bacterium]